jgi:hypothetical protein
MAQNLQVTGKRILTDALQYPVVQGDFIDTIAFLIPTIYQSVDLSAYTWQCKYVVASGAGDISTLSTEVVGSEVQATWAIPLEAVSEGGALRFQLIATLGDRIWQSTSAVISVGPQLHPSGEEFTVTVLETYLSEFNALLAQKGEPNGMAELDADGKVPASQLPSYVDDIIEVDTYASLPATGETSIIYLTLDTSKLYRWSGTAYIEISNADKADKVTGAAAGNFASLDAEGNLLDSGKKDADYEDADSTILKQAGIVDNLTSTDTDKPLSANQGKVLKDVQDVIKGAGWTNENLTDHEERINTLEADKEDASNKLTAFQSTPDDVHYPSEKLVKDNLDALDTRIEVLEEFNPLESWADVQTAVRAGIVDKYLVVGDQLVAEYNGTPRVFNVAGIDKDTPADKRFTHSITLHAQDRLLTGPIAPSQAFWHCETELAPGAHVFTMSEVQYTFTTTVAVPAGGILVVSLWGEGFWVPIAVTTYDADRVTPIESEISASMTTGTDTLEGENFNTSVGRTRYGSNNWVESAARQFLNSAEEVHAWVPKTKWDRPSSTYAGNPGFLHLLDPELVAVLGAVDKQVARNTVNEDGGQDLFSDKIFLMSRVEVGLGAEGVTTGESVYPFWDGSSNADRMKGGNWWLRSPYVAHTHTTRFVLSSGVLNNNSAYYSYGLAPACVIV